jgi:hypothetical protein
MTNITVLDNQKHRDLRVDAKASARLGDNQRFIQVIVTEFPLLAVHYPILISKDSENGAFFCGAVLGFDAQENLFLTETGHEGYRPLNLQRAPFYAAGNGLAIDLDSPRVATGEGQALFDAAGTPTPYLESVKASFGDLRPGIEMTKAFLATLMSLKLIEPVSISLGFDDGTKRELAGLYTINQQTLRALPDASVIELFRRGYLQLIYLMIASLKQIAVLAKKKNDRILQDSGVLPGRGV